MNEKKSRSMAGLPWIAAMAFFMQALDATIHRPKPQPLSTGHAVSHH